MKRSGAKGDSWGSGLEEPDDEVAAAAMATPEAAASGASVSEKEARCSRGAVSRVGEVDGPKDEVVMEAMVCCTCVQEAASPRMTHGEQGYFLSHRVLRLRHWRQLRFLTLLLLLASPLDGPAAAA